jgi:hypothetical protein
MTQGYRPRPAQGTSGLAGIRRAGAFPQPHAPRDSRTLSR